MFKSLRFSQDCFVVDLNKKKFIWIKVKKRHKCFGKLGQIKLNILITHCWNFLPWKKIIVEIVTFKLNRFNENLLMLRLDIIEEMHNNTPCPNTPHIQTQACHNFKIAMNRDVINPCYWNHTRATLLNGSQHWPPFSRMRKLNLLGRF